MQPSHDRGATGTRRRRHRHRSLSVILRSGSGSDRVQACLVYTAVLNVTLGLGVYYYDSNLAQQVRLTSQKR